MCLDVSNPYREGVVTAPLLHEMYSRIQSDDFVELWPSLAHRVVCISPPLANTTQVPLIT